MLALLPLLVFWLLVALGMSLADAWSPTRNVQTGAWLTLFFLGVLGTFWLLLGVGAAVVATVLLVGVFLGPYSALWQFSMYLKGTTRIFPVPLYPFPITLGEFEWYGMMAFGFVLTAIAFTASVPLGLSLI